MEEMQVAQMVGVDPGMLAKKATGTAEKMVSYIKCSLVQIKQNT